MKTGRKKLNNKLARILPAVLLMLFVCAACVRNTPEQEETDGLMRVYCTVKMYVPETVLAGAAEVWDNLARLPKGGILERLSANLYCFERDYFSRAGETETAAKKLKAGFIYALVCGAAPEEAEIAEFISNIRASLEAEYQTDRALAAGYDQEYSALDPDAFSEYAYGIPAEGYGYICLEKQLSDRIKTELAAEYAKDVTAEDAFRYYSEQPERFTYITVRSLLLKPAGSAAETLALAKTLAAEVHTEAEMDELAAEYGDEGWDDDHARSVVRLDAAADPAVSGYISEGPAEAGIARAVRVEDNIYIVLTEEVRTYAGTPEADPEMFGSIRAQLAEDRAEAFIESLAEMLLLTAAQ